ISSDDGVFWARGTGIVWGITGGFSIFCGRGAGGGVGVDRIDGQGNGRRAGGTSGGGVGRGTVLVGSWGTDAVHLLCLFWLGGGGVGLVRGGEGWWWVVIGAGIGLGMMAKYTMAFLAVGVVAGVLLTDLRRHLRSRWPWIGAGLALVIVSPNLIWQMRRNFV